MPVILNLCNYLRNTSKRTIIVCVLNVFLETDRVFKMICIRLELNIANILPVFFAFLIRTHISKIISKDTQKTVIIRLIELRARQYKEFVYQHDTIYQTLSYDWYIHCNCCVGCCCGLDDGRQCSDYCHCR